MESVLESGKDLQQYVGYYVQLIRKQLLGYGLDSMNNLPEDLDITLDERMLLELFLEKQHLINLQLDKSRLVVWWVRFLNLFYPGLQTNHEQYILQAIAEMETDLNTNIQNCLESYCSEHHLIEEDESVIAWRVEIRYLAQIIHYILSRASGSLKDSPLRFEFRLAVRQQTEKVIQKRTALATNDI